MKHMTEDARAHDIDPEDFLRAMLKISPEDAEKAREKAAYKGGHAEQDEDELPRGQLGPTGDHGDDKEIQS